MLLALLLRGGVGGHVLQAGVVERLLQKREVVQQPQIRDLKLSQRVPELAVEEMWAWSDVRVVDDQVAQVVVGAGDGGEGAGGAGRVAAAGAAGRCVGRRASFPCVIVAISLVWWWLARIGWLGAWRWSRWRLRARRRLSWCMNVCLDDLACPCWCVRFVFIAPALVGQGSVEEIGRGSGHGSGEVEGFGRGFIVRGSWLEFPWEHALCPILWVGGQAYRYLKVCLGMCRGKPKLRE